MRSALFVLAVLGGGGCTVILDFDPSFDAGPPLPDADLTPDAPPIAADSYEPNDVHVGSPVVAAGTYADLSIYPVGDVDFFQFTTGGGDVVIEAQFDYTAGDLDLYLYRFDDAAMMLIEVAHSTNFDTDEMVQVMALPAGTYWAKVEAFDNSFSNTYTFVLNAPP